MRLAALTTATFVFGSLLSGTAPAATAEAACPAIPTAAEIAVWGDSMAAGVGVRADQPTWLDRLEDAGGPVYRGGVPGQRIGGIAAGQGAEKAEVTNGGFTIKNPFIEPIRFSQQDHDVVFKNTVDFPLYGQFLGVRGRLVRQGEGGDSPYNFTPCKTKEWDKPVPAGTQFIAEGGKYNRTSVMVVWGGHNNFTQVGSSPDDCAVPLPGEPLPACSVVDLIGAMVQYSDSPRFLVLSLTNGIPGTGRNQVGDYYERVIEPRGVNARLAAAYGDTDPATNRYLDIRRYLVEYGLDDARVPAGELCAPGLDDADIAADIVPCSLRAGDSNHLNQYGQAVVAEQVQAALTAQGVPFPAP